MGLVQHTIRYDLVIYNAAISALYTHILVFLWFSWSVACFEWYIT